MKQPFCDISGQSQKLYRVFVPDPRGLGNSGKNCFFHMIASEKAVFMTALQNSKTAPAGATVKRLGMTRYNRAAAVNPVQ